MENEQEVNNAAADENAYEPNLPEKAEICDMCDREIAGCICGKYIKTIYILENLINQDNIEKIESDLNGLDFVMHCDIVFSTKQLILVTLGELTQEMEDSVFGAILKHEPHIIPQRRYYSKKAEKKEENKFPFEFVFLIIGIFFFAEGLIFNRYLSDFAFSAFIAAYLILGINVIVNAFDNIMQKNFLNDDLIITAATIGAFAVKQIPEAVAVMLFYTVGEHFRRISVEKTHKQISEALDLRPTYANLIVENGTKKVDPLNITVDDVIAVKSKERVPLDGVIIDGESNIDTSPITGETGLVAAKKGSKILSGCINTVGTLKVVVEKTLENSMVSKILDSVETATAVKPDTEKYMAAFAKFYTPFVIVFAIISGIVLSIITKNVAYWYRASLTFLVISCPSALVLSIPLSYFAGIGSSSQKGILLKSSRCLEKLKDTNVIVFGKTGTLTKGEYTLREVVSLADMTKDEVLEYAAKAEFVSSHPIAQGIVMAVNKQIDYADTCKEIAGKGISAQLGDETVVCGNSSYLRELGIDISDYENNYGGTEVLVAINNRLCGYIILDDVIRPDAAQVIDEMKSMGIKTVLITGDCQEIAETISYKVGFDEVYAGLLPDEKLRKLNSIRKKYGNVMFIGDAVSDEHVIAGADIGCAFGNTAHEATETADVVFMRTDMTEILDSIKTSIFTDTVSTQNIFLSVSIKILVFVFVFLGFASMWWAILADSGVAMICILNSLRILYKK